MLWPTLLECTYVLAASAVQKCDNYTGAFACSSTRYMLVFLQMALLKGLQLLLLVSVKCPSVRNDTVKPNFVATLDSQQRLISAAAHCGLYLWKPAESAGCKLEAQCLGGSVHRKGAI